MLQNPGASGGFGPWTPTTRALKQAPGPHALKLARFDFRLSQKHFIPPLLKTNLRPCLFFFYCNATQNTYHYQQQKVINVKSSDHSPPKKNMSGGMAKAGGTGRRLKLFFWHNESYEILFPMPFVSYE